jgi:hypothetical protein
MGADYFEILVSSIIIIIFHHEFGPGWPVLVSAIMSSNSLLHGRPVIIFLLDDNLEVVLGACCPPAPNVSVCTKFSF